MLIGYNEIQRRAIKFAKDWEDASDERGEAQLFWRDLLEVFGINVRAVGRFEERVRNIRGTYSRIDLFWPSVLLAEHKSRGEDLGRAHAQASQYIIDLQTEGRGEEIPRYLLVSDFEHIVVHDLETDRRVDIKVSELHRHIRDLEFIAGINRKPADPEDPVNIEAAGRLAKLKDALEAGGYPAHDLERFMVRILFCLFAEDTGLLGEPDAFRFYIENNTKPDGSDLGLHIAQWFEVLDLPANKRSGNLDEQLRTLRYVNGELFAGRLPFASFNRDMRDRLLACCRFDWSKISPAVFGSLFQSIMTAKERRQIGAHYTTERDILKVIRSLFLDELYERFEKIKNSKSDLKKLHVELGRIKILDPACGCGNFLVIAYRELRRLEIEVLKVLHPKSSKAGGLFNVPSEMLIDVDQMYGIEIEEWPAQIAKVALWLVDHQMNVELSEAFGDAVVRLPLTHSARIANANALRMDWNEVLPAGECSYVLGNPPFVGKKEQTRAQKSDMMEVWKGVKGAGTLDYVTGWYKKAGTYIGDTPIRAAFVSTNSITQGEQVGILWDELFKVHGIQIDFGYRTFAWESEARGKAHVHVVIIGFSKVGAAVRVIHETTSADEPPVQRRVSRISPYLTEGDPVAVKNRSKPLNAPTGMHYGSFALDDGHFTLSRDDRDALLAECPAVNEYIKPFIGARELLHDEERFCIWLQDLPPGALKTLAPIEERVKAVKKWRASRDRARTVELAETPHLFAEVRQPTTDYLAVPTVCSETRDYIPIRFLPASIIASNQIYVVPSASMFHFGVLHSELHMAWVRQVSGRIKSDFRYSNRLVYNNFPWPAEVPDKQREAVEAAAQAVLDARAQFPQASLAELYDPLSMRKPLRKAHTALDRAVDRCYRPQPFPDERRRFEYLFELWETLERPLAQPAKKKGRRKKQSS
jgi:hypothetical protein